MEGNKKNKKYRKKKDEKGELKIILNNKKEELDKKNKKLYINIKRIIEIGKLIENVEEKERKENNKKKTKKEKKGEKKMIKKNNDNRETKKKEKKQRRKKENRDKEKEILKKKKEEIIHKKINNIIKEKKKRKTNKIKIEIEIKKKVIGNIEKTEINEYKKKKEKEREEKILKEIIWKIEKKKLLKKKENKGKEENKKKKEREKQKKNKRKKGIKKRIIKICTYSIDSLNKGYWHKREIIQRLKNKNINIVALQETRMENEIEIIEGWEITSTIGKKDKGNKVTGGTSIIIDRNIEREEEIIRVEDYITKVTVNIEGWGRTNIISFYSAQEKERKEVRERYEKLEEVIKQSEGKIMLLGDFNTKIGKDMIGKGKYFKTEVIGKQVYNEKSSKGAKNLIDLAEKMELVIGCAKKYYKKRKREKKKKKKEDKEEEKKEKETEQETKEKKEKRKIEHKKKTEN